MFIGFTNFYQYFIQSFSRITALFTLLLKATGLLDWAPKTFGADNNKVVRVGGRANRTVMNLSKNEKSRNLTHMPNIGAMEEPNFLIPNAKKAFNYLQLAFIIALILRHFDPECHIRIETNISGYIIDRVLSQLNLDSDTLPNNLNSNKSDFGQWHLIAYFSRKMIPIET